MLYFVFGPSNTGKTSHLISKYFELPEGSTIIISNEELVESGDRMLGTDCMCKDLIYHLTPETQRVLVDNAHTMSRANIAVLKEASRTREVICYGRLKNENGKLIKSSALLLEQADLIVDRNLLEFL